MSRATASTAARPVASDGFATRPAAYRVAPEAFAPPGHVHRTVARDRPDEEAEAR